MSLILHRFPLSHFSEKARACLDFKGLDYRVVEHFPGPDQLKIYRLSGQRKVPVLEHDTTVVADSTEIGLYLERAFPESRRLLPGDPARRDEVLALEDRLDETLGARLPFLTFANVDRDEHIRETLAISMSPRVAAVAGAFAAGARAVGSVVAPLAQKRDEVERLVRDTLADLSRRLEATKYLVGDEPSFADIAAVTLAQPLKYPRSRYLATPRLAGHVGNAIALDPAYARFFDWRDQFYSDFLK